MKEEIIFTQSGCHEHYYDLTLPVWEMALYIFSKTSTAS
jgi:hypothetical protein